MKKVCYCILLLLVFTVNSDDIFSQDFILSEMILMNGGSFNMGCTPEQGNDCDDDEKPAHKISVDSFYIGKYAVTCEEYHLFCTESGITHDKKRYTIDSRANGVTWYDCILFCNWLSLKTGNIPCYLIDSTLNPISIKCNFKNKGYRLPTEAEWEYSARGGDQSKGYKYSGTNAPDKWNQVENESGLYGMSNSSWEWCWDFYDSNYYNISDSNNPAGPESGKSKVVRGGCFFDDIINGRVSERYYFEPAGKDVYLSFRIAMTK